MVGDRKAKRKYCSNTGNHSGELEDVSDAAAKDSECLYAKVVAFEFLIFVMVGSAFGQTVTKAVFKIPFEFGAGSKVLPAGTYTFSLDTGRSLVDVSSPSGKQVSLHIVTRLGGPSELREFSLVFDKTGEHHVLSEVWLPKTDGVLVHSVPKDHEHEILIGSFGGQSLSGKAAFDQTCSRCHGKDGRGDENADRFFKTKIPRLSEAYVQGKSDAELKEIITKGTRAMEPVRIEEAGFRHLLPLESVDSVIVYVRTLKP